MMGIKMIDDYYINVVERRIFLFYTVLFDEKIFEIKPSQILIQMLTNNSNYLSGNRDKLGTRDYLKKKKSQQAFLMKAKLNSQLTDQLKYLQTRKSQTKLSSSLLEIEHKDSSKRLASLEITQPDAQLSQFPSNKQGHSRNNKNIGHCWSERNINLANDAAKLQKYRKFSSNAEIRQQCQQNDSHKRKLSLVDYPNQKESINKIHKYPLMAWLLILRKIFIEEQKKRNMKIIKLPSLLLEIGKVQEMNLQLILAAVQSFEYEIELTKAQIIAIIESTFTSIKKNKSKTDTHPKVCYMDIVNCLIKFQQKNPIISKQSLHKSTSSEEDVQTARFQQGNISQEMRKRKQSQKKTQLQGLMPKMQTHKSLKQNGKQNVIASVNINNGIIFKNSSIPKSKQSLNPSTSPVCKEKGSIQNSRIIKKDEGSPFILKKSGFQLQGSHSQSLGMLSIEGKSPRELMVSQIYQSMHKQGIIPQSNVSFSLQNLDMDNHYSFQQTVRSFEDFLKKIESIQKSYRNRIQNQLQAKADEQINLFLQQLINYRIATSNQPFGQENCSYLVSFDNLGEVKQHNRGIMQALIQSNSLKEYFASIQGIKIRNCPHLLRSVSNLFHNGLRIINISHNNLKKLNNLFENISSQNSIQFFNISNNNITDITPILQCCPRLKQLHCNSNSIQQIRHVQKVVSEQLKIVDLSDNKIEIQDNLIGLVGLPSIVIINIDNNPITRRDWKIMWNGSISLSCIYQMQNLYVMSSYGHQKDITFSIDKNPPKTQKDRYSNTELIRQFSISQTNKIQISNQSLQQSKIFIKSQIYQLAKPPTTKNQSRQSEPKQKISKIKAFIDGKVI